ncbi:hypothetical protein BEWA_013030 [Theileria equi strain WA]|uniref:Signal peptide containing protein n=1 Tax=Theileria equi strain WA TaxID=1537102 RepID=L1LBV8_THEEQ|nr:hypothetical protein BEWA_013030 [Theileria equi strain WA]EKX72744.1 hypothetical protein BEWA_013030 [Theileria equi strain WA]|eukprot:XP_004832196.1 hypothetical protein BEWA_013030 [Theileria equi strain WA]
MRIFSLLYTILFIKLVRSEKKITLDILKADQKNTKVEVRKDSGIEIKTYSPKDGFRINKVKYGSKQIWSSSWTGSEGCKSIQFHSKGETRLVALWIVGKDKALEIKRFNKVGDKWEKIELEGFNKKIREAKGQDAVEQPKQVTPSTPQGPIKTNGQVKAAVVQQPASKQTTQPNTQATQQNFSKPQPPQGRATKPEAVPTSQSQRPTPISNLKSKANTSSFDVRESNSNGVFYLTCTPRSGVVATKLVYGGETIWDGGRRPLSSALIYFKGDKPEVVTLQYKENGKDRTLFLHYNGEEWEHNKKEHERKLNALKGRPLQVTQPAEPKGASLKVHQVPTPPKPTEPVTLNLANPDQSKVHIGDRSGNGIKSKNYSPKDTFHISSVMEGKVEVWNVVDPNTKCKLVRVYANSDIEVLYLDIDCNGNPISRYFEKQNGKWNSINKIDFDRKVKSMKVENIKDENPPEPEEPVSPFLDKVDSSLFHVEEAEEDGVKVLKLKAKEGVTANKLTYGSDVVWEDKKKTCLSAILYMDGEKPTLAVLETRNKNNKQNKVYRYHNGKEWKNDNEGEHNSKLSALKKKCKTVITPTPSPANTTKPVTSQANAPKPTTPFKLDITNPDRTKIIIKDVNGNGLPYREYVAKGGYHISSVLDGKVNLWIAPQGQQCIAVKSFIQDAVTIIAIFIKEGETRRRKCIEKAGGRWKDIDGQTFEEKLKAIREERVAGNEGAGNDGSPFGIRSPDDTEEAAPKPNAAKKSEHVVNVHASEIYTPPAKKQEVATKPESVTEDTEPQAPSKPLTNCSLDLANIDEDEISVKENKNYGGGVTQKDFSPKEGFKIDYILNNGTPVIKLSEGEEFRSIRLYSKGSSYLLMITIKKGQVPEHQYHERIGGDWYKLKDKNEFNRKLNAMKGSG